MINRVGLESYLLGVVSAEMGRRGPTEQAALRAQAIVSRTYALRNLGRWKAQGFDLAATVADQVYSGQGAETPEGRAAVVDTRGRVLTYAGAPIEAFFYSTCGGRTADGAEVFRGTARPYLRSVRIRPPMGVLLQYLSPVPLARGVDRRGPSEHTGTKPAAGRREAKRGCPRGQQPAGEPSKLVRPGRPARHRTGRTGNNRGGAGDPAGDASQLG